MKRRILIAIVGAAALVSMGSATTPSRAAPGARSIEGAPVSPSASSVVSFAQLASNQPSSGPFSGQAFPFSAYAEPAAAPARPAAPPSLDASLAPSPEPSLTYRGMEDSVKLGSNTYVVPPGTNGAVGPDKVLTTLSNNYRIQNKATGSTFFSLAMETFWEALGAFDSFDPKTLYDPYNNRFIVVGVSDPQTPLSSVNVGVSLTSDPAGFYALFRFKICQTVACAGGANWWADYPSVGFSKNWVAVSVNMHDNATNAFMESRLLVLDYPQLRAGHPLASLFSVATSPSSFAIQPCATYSTSENTLYAPNHVSSAAATYRLNTIKGTPSTPTFTSGPVKAHALASLSGGWTDPGGNILPQANGVAGETSKVSSGDARILKCVFRNNRVWYTQTVGLPAGGTVARTGAQWVKLTEKGNDADGGRVQDPTATATNGGKWYAYPSIAVNGPNDALLGFSQFSSTQFPSAAYAVRSSSDTAGTMRDPFVYRAGQGHYWKSYPLASCTTGQNRWGDYSVAQVDPSDDTSMWTLQESSAPQGSPFAPTGCGSGVWDTWWAKVQAPTNPTAATVLSLSARRSSAGSIVTWRTVAESRILGFNVWRDRVKVNRKLIAARHSGEARGARYRVVDRAALRSSTYRLQVVELSGRRSWYRVG